MKFKFLKSGGLPLFSILYSLYSFMAHGASTVATINGNPVTDIDITARTRLMSLQGQSATNNRVRALSNIIDDYVKVAHAENMRATPTDADVDRELAAFEAHVGALDASARTMARFALRAQISWQIVIGRTIIPTIKVSEEDIAAEKTEMERERGLPIEVTFIRLTDIPADAAAKLTTPRSCTEAEAIARNLGGAPLQITAVEYELAADVRARLVGLPLLTWSPRVDNSVILVCSKKKTTGYGNLDEIIKQNASYRRAMFMADQQLKQLRRKAVIVIQDNNYKGAV